MAPLAQQLTIKLRLAWLVLPDGWQLNLLNHVTKNC